MEELLKRLDDLDRRRKFNHFPTEASERADRDFKAILAGHWDAIRRALVATIESETNHGDDDRIDPAWLKHNRGA